jgi:CRISPR-associated protein Cas2
MTAKRYYVVTYDIVETKKRTRIADILKDYGVRVQKSVFECHIRPDDLRKMTAKMAEVIDGAKDSVMIYPLCQSCFGQKSGVGLIQSIHPDEECKVL